MNKYHTLIGHAGKDAKVIQTSKGPVSKFSIAVFCGKDKEPLWFDIVCWGESGQSVKRGDLVEVTGYFKRESWTDKNGVAKESTPLVVASGEDGHALIKVHGNAAKPKPEPKPEPLHITDEDIPF